MTSRTYRHRAARVALFAMLLLTVLPAHYASAVLTANKVIASNNADFVTGRFGMTGLVESGGVQLLPLGSLARMRTGQPPLCRPLAEMGTASYQTMIEVSPGVKRKSTYLYVVGGQTNGLLPLIDTTCYTYLKNDAGITANWTEDDSKLPKGLYGLESFAARTPTGQGYLYALGGLAGTSLGNQTSQAEIYRATISETTGAIGAWQQIGLLPGDPDVAGDEGRHSFGMATYVDDKNTPSTADDTTYVYIFGGSRRFFVGSLPNLDYYRDVWRTTLKSDGTFGEDGATNNGWTRLGDIPVRTPSIKACAGLFDSQAVTFDVVKGDSSTVIPTLYLLGGRYDDPSFSPCNQNSETSSDVYRATIGALGSLTWDSVADDPAVGADPVDRYTLLNPLYGHKAFGFNQKIYVLGGYDIQGSGGPSKRVYSAYADEEQDLVPVSGDANFIASDEIITPARYAHGGQTAYYNGFPMLFIFGGRSSNDTSVGNDFLDTVLYAIPGEDEASAQGVSSQGIYLSPAFDFEATTKPISMTWSAILTDPTTDIKMAFRVGTTATSLATATWFPMDGVPDAPRWTAPGNPVTETVLIDNAPQGRFFQYRAILTSPNRTNTPILTQVRVSYEIDGFPNLVVDDDLQPSFPADDTQLGQGPSVRLANEVRTGGTTNFVLDADIQSDGTFFVDMFVFPPDAPVRAFDYNFARGLSDPDLLASKAFVEVNKFDLPRNGEYDIPVGAWKRSCSADGQTPDLDCPYMTANDWEILFNESGDWTIVLVVDSGNNVHEGDTIQDAWEANNITAFTVNIDAPPARKVFMPFISRQVVVP